MNPVPITTCFIRRCSLSWLMVSALVMACCFLGIARLRAAPLFWDADTGTFGVQDGAGTWSGAGTTWWNWTSNGNVSEVAADTVFFGGGAFSSGGVITLSGNQQAVAMILGRTITSGYSFVAGAPTTLTLGAGGITVLPEAQAATIGDANLSLVLSAAQTWNNLSSNTLTIGGGIDLDSNILTLGVGDFDLNGVITGAGGLNLSGGGTTTVTGSNDYTGTTVLGNGSTLVLSGANGALTGTSGITLNGGTLTLDNSVTANSDRLGNAIGIIVNGTSQLNHNVNGTAGSYSESLGALTLAGGALQYLGQFANTGETSAVTFAGLTQSGTGTVNFIGNGNLGTTRNQVFITGQATGDIGPWATFSNATFAAYDLTLGVVASAVTNLGSPSTQSDPTVNFRQNNANRTITSGTDPEYKTLTVSGGTARTLTVTGNTIYLISGGLMATGANHIMAAGGTLTTGLKTAGTSVPLYAFVGDANGTARTYTINSVIADNPGGGALDLVKSGKGSLILTALNTYTGVTTINEGTLQVNSITDGSAASGTLGTSSNAASNLVLAGGNLRYNAAASTPGSTDRLFTLTEGGGGIDNFGSNNNTLSFTNSGSIAASGTGDRTLTLRAGGTGQFAFNPIIVDPSSGKTSMAVSIPSTAVMRLNGNSTYSGDSSLTAAAGGILRVNAAGALGTGTWTLGSGSVLEYLNDAANRTYTGDLFIGENNVTLRVGNSASAGAFTATVGDLTLGTGTLTYSRGANQSTNTTSSIVFDTTTLTGSPTINLNAASGSSSYLVSLGALNDGGFARTITIIGASAGTGDQFVRLFEASSVFSAGTNIDYQGGNVGGIRLDSATAFGTASNYGTITFNAPATSGGLQLRNNNATNFRTNLVLGDNDVRVEIGGTSSTQPNTTHTAGALSIGTSTLTLTGSLNTAADNIHSLTLLGTTFTGNAILNVANVNGTATGRLTLGALDDGAVARSITKTGAATLRLNTAATSMIGGTTLTATDGIVEIGNATALGSATLVMGDGVTSGQLVVLNGNTLDSGTTITYAGGWNTLDAGAISGPTTGTSTISGTININDVVLAGAGHFQGGGGTLILTGPIVTGGTSGGEAIIRNGNVQLSQATGNTYTQLTIAEGITSLGVTNGIKTNANVSVATLGNATLDFNGVNQTVDASATWTLGGGPTSQTTVATVATGANTLFLNGTLANSADSTATQLVTGAIDLGGGTGTFAIDNGALTSDMTVSASVSNGSLLKTGGGILTLSGTNSLGAGSNVNVSDGTLIGSFGTGGTATITVGASGSLQFVNNMAEILTLDGSAGALTLGSGSRLGFELGASGTNDRLIAGNTASTVAGNVLLDFYDLGSLEVGTYDLITATGGLNTATYLVGSAPLGFNYTLTQSGTLVQLTTAAIIARYWTGDNGTSWATTSNTNWSSTPDGLTDPGTVPGSTETVIFSAANAPGPSIGTTLDDAFIIEGMQFISEPSSPNAVTDVTINNSASSSLTISTLTSSAGIFVGDNAGTITLGTGLPVTAGSNQTWTVTGTGLNGSTLIVNANVAFSNSVTKAGAGALTLAGTNTGNGGVILSAGKLNLNSAAALGTTGAGNLTIGAGTTIDTTAGDLTLNNNLQTWNGNFTFAGTNNLNLGTGAVTMGNNVNVTTTAGELTVGGAIGDGGNNYLLTKLGIGGALTLSGANSHGGGVRLTEGTLNVNNAGALGSGTFSINGGTIDNTSGADITLSTNNVQEWNGDFTFTGTDDLNLGAGTVTFGTGAGTTRTVTVTAGTLTANGGVGDGAIATALTKAGAGVLQLGGTSSFTGAVSVNEGVLRSTGTVNNGTSVTNVANAASLTGLMIVSAGDYTTNKFNLGNALGAAGALVIDGGSVTTTLAASSANFSLGQGGGYGGIFINSGSLTAGRIESNATVADSTAVIRVTGGTLNASEYFIMRNLFSEITVTGGLVNHNGASQNIALGYQNNGTHVLTVAGGTLDNTGRNITVRQNGNAPTGIVNINAGTVITNDISVGNAAGTGIVNFNGGTLTPGSNGGTLLPTNITAAYVNGAFGTFTGGAVIDTAANNTTIAEPLLAPTGDGVMGLSVTTSGNGYVGAPYVNITGDGTGATAYAVVDQDPTSLTFGQVTGIVLTNPGVGYTTASVTLVGGGGSGAVIAVNTISANASGGLTKNGDGTLTLSGANTFTGDTVINGGTLSLGGASGTVLDNAAAVTINNGSAFNVNSRSETVGLVTLNDGSIDGTSGVLTGSSFEFKRGSVSAILGGIGGLTKTTADTVTLSGVNLFTGAVNVSEGLLSFAASANLGDSTAPTNVINLGGGTLTTSTLQYTGSGAVDLGANRVFTVGAGTSTIEVTSSTAILTVSGGIANTSTGNLVKTGAGVLEVTNNVSVDLDGGTVNVSDGVLRAGLTDISALTVSSTGTLELKDNTGVALTLGSTPGALTLTGGAILGFELGSPVNFDSITVAAGGTAVTSGTITLNLFDLGGINANTYNLIVADSGLNGATFVLGTAPSGFSYSLNQTDSLLSLITTAFVPRYWTGDQSTSWSTDNTGDTNWSTTADGLTEAGAVPGAADTVIFSATNAAGTVIDTTLDAAFTVDSLQFLAAPTGVTAVNINNSIGSSLELAPAGTTGGIFVDDNAGVVTLGAGLPVTVTNQQNWGVTGTGLNGSELIVNANVAFNEAVNKTLAGTLTLAGTNTGSSVISLLAGQLNINSTTAMGGGTFTIANLTTIDNTSGGAIALANDNAQNWNGSFTFTGSNDLDMGEGAVLLGANVTVTTTAGNLTIGGIIGDGAGSFSITKVGDGTLTLGGANTFEGGVQLDVGQININNASALGTGTFTINGGVIDNTSGGAVVSSTNNAQAWNAGLTFTGTDDLDLGTGGVTMGADITITTTGGVLTVGGIIDDGVNSFDLTKLGTGTLVLGGASTYDGGNTNIDEGTLMIGVDDALPIGTSVRLGNLATAATLDLNGFDLEIGGLFVRTNSLTETNQIVIDPGKTLTVTGNVTLGANANASTTLVTASGGGSFVQTSSGGIFQVGGATGNNFENAVTADFTGLAGFTVDLGTTGTFRIGDNSSNTGVGSASVVTLAPVSSITAGTVNIGSVQSSATQTLHLGSTSNAINTNTLNIGTNNTGRGSGVLDFATGTGTLTLRAADTTSRAALNLINSTFNTGNSQTATVDLAGHDANLLISTLTMASRTNNSGNATATFTFDEGTFDATNVVLAQRTLTSTGDATATLNLGDSVTAGTPTVTIGTLTMAENTSAGGTTTATLNVSGGNVGIGSINMANTSAGRSAVSEINLTGGTTTLGGNITRGGGLGSEDATITLDGGTFDMGGNSIGAAGLTGLITLNAESGNLRNLNELNGGGDLTKTTAGILILEGTNTYTGNTVVIDGTLQLGSGAGTGSMNIASAISVDTGATFAVKQNDTVTQGNDFATVAITGDGGFAQTGSGTTILTADNTYLGATTVSDGVLLVNGDQTTATGAVTVTDTAGGTPTVLGGNGKIGGDTTIASGAFLQAGDVTTATPGITTPAIGTLEFAGANTDLTFSSGSTWLVDLTQSATLTSDQIKVGGQLNITSGAFLDINFTDLGFTQGHTYKIAQYNTWDNGLFTYAGYGGLWGEGEERTIGGNQYKINYAFVDGGNFITLTAVPEPGTFGLLGLALAGLAFLRFRKRRQESLAMVDGE